MRKEPSSFEWIVIGSGLGGLSFASLLARDGKKVLVLEKAKELGGCASSYTYEGFRFEAGATTLVGWEKDLPLHQFFSSLGFEIQNLSELNTRFHLILKNTTTKFNPENLNIQSPIFLVLSPSMDIYMKDFKLTRNENKEEWIEHCKKVFGEPIKQRLFWKFIFYLSSKVWNLSNRMKSFPPNSLKDYWNCLKRIHLTDIFLFLLSFFSFSWLLKLPFFPKNPNFLKFLDEQLMITVQTSHKESPIPMGSCGITYAHLKNTYVVGGLGELANFLAKFIQLHGGVVHSLEEVNSIQYESSKKMFLVGTRKGKIYSSNNIVCGIPIWNLNNIIQKSIDVSLKKHNSLSQETNTMSTHPQWVKLCKEVSIRAKKFSKNIWGAYQLGLVIPEFRETPMPIHYQFHLESPLSFGGGKSIFVSCSHIEDTHRILNPSLLQIPANTKILVMSISTHLESPESWSRKDIDYKKKKETIQEEILNALEKNWKGFHKENIIHIHSATPATWETWTGRYQGRVGGIPGSYFHNPFQFPSPITPMPGFYCLGDTVYPGQGIPAVILGACNLYHRLHGKNS